MERRDRKAKRRQARKAASEADAARQSQDMGKEETEMQKVSKTDGQKTAAAGTKAPETEPARCYTLMCTGDLGTAPVMVFRNEGDANDMMRALEQVAPGVLVGLDHEDRKGPGDGDRQREQRLEHHAHARGKRTQPPPGVQVDRAGAADGDDLVGQTHLVDQVQCRRTVGDERVRAVFD